MSAIGKPFIGLLPPSETRPIHKDLGRGPNIVRNSLTFPAWLAVGAVLQSLLYLLGGRIAVLPAIAFLAFNLAKTLAATLGWIPNPDMENVILEKYSAQFPDAQGRFSAKPADQPVVVFLLGARANHPLGILAPGFKTLGDHFGAMNAELKARSAEFDFLGATTWSEGDNDVTNPGVMQVCYFRSTAGLHKFAHSELHMKGWTWYSRIAAQNPHLTIWHETYSVPKGHWETIYVNGKGNLGLDSTAHRYVDPETGKEMWARSVVDASKGLLKTGAGRMAKSNTEEYEKY